MTWKRKFRGAALVAAINFALSTSVLAMPTGGVLAGGNVTGLDNNGTVASGGTLATAGGPAIINWGAFGLANGEQLTVNTAAGALLNRVTGTQLSELRGLLTQTGEHPMLLINPNGIIVGNTASINAQSLILSTLNMKDAEFNSANGSANNSAVFTDGKAAAGVKVEKGAKFSVSELLQMFGGTVNVADNVTFSAPAKDGGANQLNLAFVAANKAASTYGAREAQDNSVSIIGATKDNTVDIGAATIQNNGRDTRLDVLGGTVNLAGTLIKLDEDTKESGAYLGAGTMDAGTFKAGSDNVVTLKNAVICGGADAMVFAGKIDMENSYINVDKDTTGTALLAAGSSIIYKGGSASDVTVGASDSNTLTISGMYDLNNLDSKLAPATIHADRLFLLGGKVSLANAVIAPDDSSSDGRASSQLLVLAGNSAHIDAGNDKHIGLESYSGTDANSTALINTNIGGSYHSIDLGGGQLNLTQSSIKSTNAANYDEDYGDPCVELHAVKSYEDMNGQIQSAFDPKNQVTLDNSSIEMTGQNGQEIDIMGGAITLKNGSALTSQGIKLFAMDTSMQSDTGKPMTINNTGANAVTVTDSTLKVTGNKASSLHLEGGNIHIAGTSKVTAPVIYLVAGKTVKQEVKEAENTPPTYTYTVTGRTSDTPQITQDKTAAITSSVKTYKIVELPTPVDPGKTPGISKDVQANSDKGEAAMDALLKKNTSFAAQQAAIGKLARKVRHETSDRNVKAAELVGAVTAIRKSTLTEMRKAALIQSAVKEFDAAVDADHQLSSAAQDSRQASLPTAAATTTTALAGRSADTPLVKGL